MTKNEQNGPEGRVFTLWTKDAPRHNYKGLFTISHCAECGSFDIYEDRPTTYHANRWELEPTDDEVGDVMHSYCGTCGCDHIDWTNYQIS